MSDEPANDYGAFISYRHTRSDRKWAKWLHAQLESYRTPKPLVRLGVRPKVGRVFRDEEELAASADLSREIADALARSYCLIVVCSPCTPASQWVNEEVERFRQMGRDDQILALLIEGEPQQAFPKSLCEIRRDLVESGGETQPQIDSIEPLAADARPSYLETPRYVKRMALLKLLAGILGCRFDDLRQREQERRTRRFMLLSTGLALLVTLVSLLSAVAWHQWGRAEDARKVAVDARLEVEKQLRISKAQQLVLASKAQRQAFPQQSLLLAAEAMRAIRQDTSTPLKSAQENLLEVLGQVSGIGLVRHATGLYKTTISTGGRWLVSEGRFGDIWLWDLHADDPRRSSTMLFDKVENGTRWQTSMSSDGRWLAIRRRDTPAKLWDLASANPSVPAVELEEDKLSILAFAFSPDSRWLVARCQDGAVRRWDLSVESIPSSETVLPAYAKPLTTMAVSSDSRKLATASEGSSVRLWDLNRKDPRMTVMTLPAHPKPVSALAFAAGDRFLVSASTDETLRLWDIAARPPKTVSSGKVGTDSKVTELIMSSDRRWVVTKTGNTIPSDMELWEISADQAALLHVKLPNFDQAAFSNDNRWLVTGRYDTIVRAYDLTADDVSESEKVMSGHERGIESVAIGPDNRWAATSSFDGTVRLWDLAAKNPLLTAKKLLGHEAGVKHVSFSSDGRWLVSGSDDTTVRLWPMTRHANILLDKTMSTRFNSIPNYRPDRHLLVVARDGPGLATHSMQGVKLSDNGHVLEEFSAGTHGLMSSWDAVISPNRRWIATGDRSSNIQVWSLSGNPSSLAPIEIQAAVQDVVSISFTADSSRLITGHKDGAVRGWPVSDMDAKPAPHALAGHEKSVSVIACSKDQRWLATGSSDKTVRLWDLSVGDLSSQPFVLQGHNGFILTMQFSPDGRHLVTAGGTSVRIWDLASDDPSAVSIELPHERQVQKIRISPDNRWLITSNYRKEAYTHLWDLSALDPSKAELRLGGHTNGILAMEFSPNSRWFASASLDHLVILWDLNNLGDAKRPHLLRGHDEGVNCLAFSSDGHWLVSGAAEPDNSLRLWDLTVEEPSLQAIVLRGHTASVKSVTFSQDSTWMLSTSRDGTIRRWSLRSDELVEQAARCAGRNLSAAEWQQFFPGQAYRKTFEQFPGPFERQWQPFR